MASWAGAATRTYKLVTLAPSPAPRCAIRWSAVEPERGLATEGLPNSGRGGSRIPRWMGIWIGGAIGFGVLIALAKVWDSITEHGTVVRVDQRWLSALTTHRTSWVTAAFRGVAWFGDMRVISAIVALTAVVLVLRHVRIYAVLLVAAAAGAATLAATLKAVLSRPRPPVPGHLVATAGSAFPSGHATQAAACYGALAWVVARQLVRRGRRILVWSGAIVLVGLVGLSRVYLGVHWPSDVGGGWALGTGWLAVCVSVLLATRSLLQGPWTLPSAANSRSP
jgi:undecaprenyl-diphosphatase